MNLDDVRRLDGALDKSKRGLIIGAGLILIPFSKSDSFTLNPAKQMPQFLCAPFRL